MYIFEIKDNLSLTEFMDVWQNRFAKLQVGCSEAVQTQEDERRTAEPKQNKEAEATIRYCRVVAHIEVLLR